MAILWQYYGNTMAILWQYYGNTMAILWQYYGTMTALRFFATMIDMRIKSNQYMLRVHLGYNDGPIFKKSERLKMVGVLETFTIDYGTWDAWSYNVTRETLQALCHSKNAAIHDSIRLQTTPRSCPKVVQNGWRWSDTGMNRTLNFTSQRTR